MVIRVGILRGGPSAEYEVSLNTGANVLKFLPDKYHKKDILLTKEGEWYTEGLFCAPEKIFKSVDVVFNALHGHFGEDGRVQQIFEAFNIPYTGSGIFASAAAMNKPVSREIFKEVGIKVPRSFVVKESDEIENVAFNIFRNIGPSLVVKPAASGSSVGVSIVHSFPELLKDVYNVFQHGSTALIEEYIRGREVTCGVIENFRGKAYYALPVIEIIPPPTAAFFDYCVKYDGATREICPSYFDDITKKHIQDMAVKAHRALGCRHYSRADMIVSRNGIYLLEVNTLPGLTSESLLPKAAEAIGLSFPCLLDHLIQLALNR